MSDTSILFKRNKDNFSYLPSSDLDQYTGQLLLNSVEKAFGWSLVNPDNTITLRTAVAVAQFTNSTSSGQFLPSKNASPFFLFTSNREIGPGLFRSGSGSYTPMIPVFPTVAGCFQSTPDSCATIGPLSFDSMVKDPTSCAKSLGLGKSAGTKSVSSIYIGAKCGFYVPFTTAPTPPSRILFIGESAGSAISTGSKSPITQDAIIIGGSSGAENVSYNQSFPKGTAIGALSIGSVGAPGDFAAPSTDFVIIGYRNLSTFGSFEDYFWKGAGVVIGNNNFRNIKRAVDSSGVAICNNAADELSGTTVISTNPQPPTGLDTLSTAGFPLPLQTASSAGLATISDKYTTIDRGVYLGIKASSFFCARTLLNTSLFSPQANRSEGKGVMISQGQNKPVVSGVSASLVAVSGTFKVSGKTYNVIRGIIYSVS